MNERYDPLGVYRERQERIARERDALARRSRRLSLARILVFLAALALLVLAETGEGGAAALAGGTLLFAVFVALVVYHRRLKRALRWKEVLWQVQDEAIRRQRREWDRLPGADVPGPGLEHPYAADLDLFGRASLFQLLGTAATAPGRATLRAWLLAPADPAEARARQAAVAELAPDVDLRDELAVGARVDGDARPEEVAQFLAWAEGEPWLLRRPALVWASRLLPLATLGFAIADLAGAVDRPFWVLSLLAGLVLSWTVARPMYATFARAFAREGAFRQYAGLFRVLAGARFRAPRLQAIGAALTAGGVAAHRRMHRLGRLMELADLRFSPMAHFPIHALTLWDFHVLHALERWQQQAGRHARRWLEALGEAEALAALATLAHDNPGWTFPEIAEGDAPVIDARALGHPLLADDVRVTNDVAVGPPGTFLLVTGSNMSGKSTLLRAIGLNVVVGQAGGPVCAASMRVPPVAVATSIRVADSLEKGVSYFMAELQRLKLVVDLAREVHARGERTLLYLLDEILHGTNSAERQVAAQRVIAHLVDQGAIGAVSTHDIALAADPALLAAARPVHFTETFERRDGRPVMSFDYRLRPGVATSTNALKLMEIVGLTFEGEGEPSPS